MATRVIVPALLAFALAATAAAKDIPLERGTSPPVFTTIYNFEEYEEGDGWDDESFLTAKARTTEAYFPFGDLEENGLLLSVDTRADGAVRPDTLYVDLDGSRTLDNGETFALKTTGLGQAAPDNPLAVVAAEKVPIVMAEGAKPLLVDILYVPVPVNVLEYAPVLLGIQTHECRRGTVTLGVETFDLVLKDRTVNGAFNDFEGENDFGSDALSLIPRGKELPLGHDPYAQPLRRRLFQAGKAFTVNVDAAGTKLSLEPLATAFGALAASAGDIEMTLVHPEWGTHTVKAGEERMFPAGSWQVKSFRCVRQETGAHCEYEGPEGMAVAIGEEKKAAISLETALQAVIKAQRARDNVVLALELKTSQGARFLSYLDPAAVKPFEGVPFSISDRSGNTVHEAVFKFG
jgi:hypothetical protein